MKEGRQTRDKGKLRLIEATRLRLNIREKMERDELKERLDEDELRTFQENLRGKGLTVYANSLGTFIEGTPSYQNAINVGLMFALGYIHVSEGKLRFNHNPEISKEMMRIQKGRLLNNIAWDKILGGDTFTTSEASRRQDIDHNAVNILILYRVAKTTSKGNYKWLVSLEERQRIYDLLSGKSTTGEITKEVRRKIEDINEMIRTAEKGNTAKRRLDALRAIRNRYVFLAFSIEMLGGNQRSLFTKNRLVGYILKNKAEKGAKINAYSLSNEIGCVAAWLTNIGVLKKVGSQKYKFIPDKIEPALSAIKKDLDKIAQPQKG